MAFILPGRPRRTSGGAPGRLDDARPLGPPTRRRAAGAAAVAVAVLLPAAGGGLGQRSADAATGGEPGLPAPWASADVGAVALPGSASHSSGTFTVTGSGAGLSGTSDAFHFVYRPMTGDGVVTARVATLAGATSGARAGVMIRETLNARAKHAAVTVGATGGITFHTRARSSKRGTMSWPGDAASAPYWVRLERRGSTVTASQSADGVAWSTVGSDSVPIASTVLVGLAVTSSSDASAATATFEGVVAGDAVDTTAPTVRITAPAAGSAVSGTVDVTVEASDATGVQAVDLVVDGVVAGRDTTPPYAFAWDASAAAAGTHTLVAKASDPAGNVGSSEPVPVGVQGPARVVWSMAGSSLTNVRNVDDSYARRHFDSPSNFVTGPGDGTQFQVPSGWSSTPVANYKSYAAFRADLDAGGRIDSRVRWVKYNPEKWDLTPLNEQEDPGYYMERFCRDAHANGYLCMTAPARSLLLVTTAACRVDYSIDDGLNDAYLRCGTAAAGARYADQFGIQGQVNQGDPARYRDFVARAAAQARAANPGVQVIANLTTSLQDVSQSSCTLYNAHRAVVDVVAGHWLHVDGGTGAVAVNLLKNIDSGACVASP